MALHSNLQMQACTGSFQMEHRLRMHYTSCSGSIRSAQDCFNMALTHTLYMYISYIKGNSQRAQKPSIRQGGQRTWHQNSIIPRLHHDC